MKFNSKNKKILIIGSIILILILVFVYFMNKRQVDEAKKTVTGGTSGSNDSSHYLYSGPGTPLTQVAKQTEAAELKDRYSGMSKEAIIADYIEFRFNRDSSYLEFLKKKAQENSESLNSVMRKDAIYLLSGFKVPGF
ncbi:hypothetical protein ACRTDU_03915 [Sunxiuqinia elliptica]